MKHRIGVSVIALLALSVILLGANGGKGEPSRVAVCDVAKVVDDYARVKSLQEELAAEEKLRVEDIRNRSDLIERLAKQMDDLKEGSDDRKKLEEKAWQQMFELEAYRKTEQGRLQRKSRKGLLACYEEIMSEIGRYAKANAIDVVLYKTDLGEQLKQAQNTQELKALINSRRVLYNNSALDITATVIAQLNAKWAVAHPPEKKAE